MAKKIKTNETNNTQSRKEDTGLDPIIAGTGDVLGQLFTGNPLTRFLGEPEEQKKVEEQALKLSKETEKAKKRAQEEEAKKRAQKEEDREGALDEIAVAIIFGGQKQINPSLKRTYKSILDENYKDKKIKKELLDHNITINDIVKQMSNILYEEGLYENLGNTYIGGLNKTVNQGTPSFNIGEQLHKDEITKHKRIISEFQDNNENIPEIIRIISNNFNFAKNVLNEKNKTPSEASAPSVAGSETSESSKSSKSFFARAYDYFSKAYDFVFSSNARGYNKISTDDSQIDSSSSTQSSSTDPDAYSISSNDSKRSTLKVLRDLIASASKFNIGNSNTENSNKNARKVEEGISEELRPIVDEISKKLKKTNDDAIESHQAQVKINQDALDKLQAKKVEAEKEAAKQAAKEEEKQRDLENKRKFAEEKLAENYSKILTRKVLDSNKITRNGKTVIEFKITDKKTKKSTTIEVTATDAKSATKELAKKTLENAYNFAKGYKNVATDSYSVAKFMTAPSPDSESIGTTLKNMAVFLNSDNNAPGVDFTGCLISAAQYFMEGMKEMPGASATAARVTLSAVRGAGKYVAKSFADSVSVARKTEISARITRGE